MASELEPTIGQEITDRIAQRERLARFFRANPDTIFSQETLAEACGADVATVRTRITECKRLLKMTLQWHSGSYTGPDGKRHRGKKRWQLVTRPADPLGRDARIPQPDRWPVFDAPIQETWRLT